MKNSIWVLLLAIGFSCDTSDTVKPRNDQFFVKYFGEDGDQYASDVVATSDGGYVLVGTSDRDKSIAVSPGSEAGYSGDENIFVIKTDAEGNEMWKQFYDGPGGSTDLGNGIIETASGFVVAGSTKTATDYDVIVLDIGADGTLISPYTYGNDSVFSTDEKGKSISLLNDGVNSYYYITGETTNAIKKPDLDYYTLRLDAAFIEDPAWELNKIVGIIGEEESGNRIFTNPNDVQFPVIFGNNDGPNINLQIYDTDTYSSWQYLALDTEGSDTYYGDENSQTAYDADQTIGGFIIIGTLNGLNPKMYFSVSNWNASSGELVDVGSRSIFTGFDVEGRSIIRSIDGGNICLGSINYAVGEKDIFLGKTSGDGGIERWAYTFGTDGIDEGAKVLENPDGSIVFTGTMNISGQRKICLIKTNANGELKL